MGSIAAALGVRSGDKEQASSFVYNAEGGSRSRVAAYAISRTDTEHDVTAISIMAVVTMETCDSSEESKVT